MYSGVVSQYHEVPRKPVKVFLNRKKVGKGGTPL
jgi:hypothetical protein